MLDNIIYRRLYQLRKRRMYMHAVVDLLRMPARGYGINHFLYQFGCIRPDNMKAKDFMGILFYNCLGKTFTFQHGLAFSNIIIPRFAHQYAMMFPGSLFSK